MKSSAPPVLHNFEHKFFSSTISQFFYFYNAPMPQLSVQSIFFLYNVSIDGCHMYLHFDIGGKGRIKTKGPAERGSALLGLRHQKWQDMKTPAQCKAIRMCRGNRILHVSQLCVGLHVREAGLS